MQILKRLKVSHAISLATILPMLVAILLLFLLISRLNEQVEQQQTVEDIVVLSGLFDDIAHNHAVERGLTAGFLASGGNSGRDKVDNQRLKANTAADALSRFDTSVLASFSEADFRSLSSPILEQLKLRQSVRQKVDALASDNNAFGYYSELNRRALVAIEKLMLRMTDKETSLLMNTRLQLLWMKERAGQYRGALNGVFNAGKTTEARKVTILSFVNDEANRQQMFLDEAPDKYKQVLNGYANDSAWVNTLSALNSFKASTDLGNINGPDNWFGIATSRIGHIKKLGDEVGSELIEIAKENMSSAVQLRNLMLILFLLVMGPVLYFGYIVNRSISSRVSKIKSFLFNVSDAKVFDQTLADDSSDEIHDIIEALNAHIKEVQCSLYGIQQQARNSHVHLDDVNLHSKEVLDDAKEQKEITQEIATAMAQMSQASSLISGDMHEAASETNTVQTRSQAGSDCLNLINESVKELDTEINQTYQIVEEVSENTSGINQILQTIESIAEQTNLLALNAAIEAARAGEQGRGFAVVADEVRSLASRTQDSTVEIRTMISNLVESSSKAIQSMEHCKSLTDETADKVEENSEIIQSLFRSVERLNESIETVASAVEEQSRVSEQINDNIQWVAEGSQKILVATDQSNHSVKDMSDCFNEMHNEIDKYQL